MAVADATNDAMIVVDLSGMDEDQIQEESEAQGEAALNEAAKN